jgi:hypothetical protein
MVRLPIASRAVATGRGSSADTGAVAGPTPAAVAAPTAAAVPAPKQKGFIRQATQRAMAMNPRDAGLADKTGWTEPRSPLWELNANRVA